MDAGLASMFVLLPVFVSLVAVQISGLFAVLNFERNYHE